MGSLDTEAPLVDLHIQFIGATGLPRMDVVGLTDPYFVAKIDDRITYISRILRDTLSPTWNEVWKVKNVPPTATLTIEVLDKDQGSAKDDSIGKFNTDVTPGAKESEITGTVFFVKKNRGTFWLKIESKLSKMPQRHEYPYMFDGPIRFTRHFSPTVGLLTSSSTVRTARTTPSSQVHDPLLYSTWMFDLRSVPLFFGDAHQRWNNKYAAAQKIFGTGAGSAIVRSTIQGGHQLLYSKTVDNGVGILENLDYDEPIRLKAVLHASGAGERIKPAVYTYVLASDDNTFRFSETGAAFFVDFASKHALHSNCSPTVRYSGEFHPRPVGGWSNFNDSTPDDAVEWELVVDNNSGTYAPDKNVLPLVKWCLEYNFGCVLPPAGPGRRGFRVVVHDRDDPLLAESRDACRDYAVKVRGVHKEDLQPHVAPGEVTLNQTAVSA